MIRRTMAVVLLALLAVPASAGAAETTVSDLITDSASYEGETVTLRGELIGDFQRRGGEVWVQLNGDAYVDAPLLEGGSAAGVNLGIGVRFPVDVFDALGVTTPGGYRVRGPVVLVTGVWRHHDEERGGESFLDATAADLLESERTMTEAFVWWEAVVGGLLLVAAGAPVLVRRRRTG